MRLESLDMAKEIEENYRHVLKYTGVFGGVQGVNIGLGLVRTKVMALLLGPSGIGLASLFNTAVTFVSQSTNMGVSFGGVRRLSELYDQGNTAELAHYVKVIRSWSLLTALLGMLACVAAAPLLNQMMFTDRNHDALFLLLAPVIGMLAITGGETAVLKGTRNLKALAGVQIATGLTGLAVSVPIYYFWGKNGIVPVILLTALITLLLTVRKSRHVIPLSLKGQRGRLGEGREMVHLGIVYTLAGIVGSLAEMLIRSYLNVMGGLDVLGFYNAGYMLTVTYAGMVFSSMETDYFPRLSGVQHDLSEMRKTVNRQMEVSLLLLSPMLVALIIGLPLLIPLLFSGQFLPVVGMAQVAALAMYLKVVTLPVAYMTLARGQLKAYLVLEGAYYAVFVLLVVAGFHLWGLYGTGLAIVGAHLFDSLIVNGYAHKKYGYRFSVTVSVYAVVQGGIGLLAFGLTLTTSGFVYWAIGLLLVGLSLSLSLRILHRKTHLWEALTKR